MEIVARATPAFSEDIRTVTLDEFLDLTSHSMVLTWPSLAGARIEETIKKMNMGAAIVVKDKVYGVVAKWDDLHPDTIEWLKKR